MTNRDRGVRRLLGVLGVTFLTVILASCIEGDEPVSVEIPGGDLFRRYVALGSSITAGFQSGGINVQTQREAYPVLLAGKAGASFGVPALAPGCLPLLVGPLTTERVPADTLCARLIPPPYVVQNLAVPGAKAAHLTDPLGTGSVLNTLILGGRTQVQAMQDADPSLVSVWIGNNDVLEAVFAGTPAGLTPTGTFQSAYQEIVAGVQATNAQDAILIGIINAAAVSPGVQPGAYFWAIAQAPPPGLPPVDVSDNCAPFDAMGNPNPLAFRLISFSGVSQAIADGAVPIAIDCMTGVSTSQPFDYLLDEAELGVIASQVAQFNAFIQSQADTNGWIYIDPATVYGPALQDPNRIRKCQALATATDPGSFAAAVVSSCPVDLDPNTATTFYGSWLSLDPVHPSIEGHTALANHLAAQLNSVHGLNLPTN
jgi:hypothetical protein